MRPEGVPEALIDIAMAGAAPGCRDDARHYLANALPAIEAETLAGVQAELDAKDAEIAEVQALLDQQAAETRKCFEAAHEGRLHHWQQRAEQAEELLRIAHDTSNRSEAERARAVQRAEAAEDENARLRAYHQQIGDL